MKRDTRRMLRTEKRQQPWYKFQELKADEYGKEECDRQDCAGCESVAI